MDKVTQMGILNIEMKTSSGLRSICHLRNERETGSRWLSQWILGLLLGTGKNDHWLIGASPVTVPETTAGRISARVLISCLKWQIVEWSTQKKRVIQLSLQSWRISSAFQVNSLAGHQVVTFRSNFLCIWWQKIHQGGISSTHIKQIV